MPDGVIWSKLMPLAPYYHLQALRRALYQLFTPLSSSSNPLCRASKSHETRLKMVVKGYFL